MVHAISSEYVPAEAAFRKLNSAWQMKSAVYIYGVTGYGKTRLVQEFTARLKTLWVSACDDSADSILLEKLQAGTLPACVIIDDLQYSNEVLKKLISSLVKHKDIWVILIGRMPPQEWIFSFVEAGRILIISENDLMLTEKEIRKMAEREQILLRDGEAEKMSEHMLGNAYGISAALRMLKSGYTYDDDLMQQMDQVYEQHLEHNIVCQWDTELREFLTQISIVDSFSLPLAVMITGDDQAAALIQAAAEVGNFLISEHGTYRLRPQLIAAMRHRALKVYGLQKYRQLQNKAGLFYETQGDILSALQMYEACENRDGIRSVLIRNARRHPGTENYYKLKKYYLALTDEEVQESIVLMSARSMLHSVLMNREKSEYWYEKLKVYAGQAAGKEKEEATVQLLLLDIALPHRKCADMTELFAQLSSVFRYGQVRFPALSLTDHQPSLMNGIRDCCAWSKNDELLVGSQNSTAEKLFRVLGKGLVHTALAESFYEKGRSVYDVLNHLTLARIEIEGGGSDDLLFVVTGIQARMNLAMGNSCYASELLDGLEKRISVGAADPDQLFLQNLRALRCRMMLLYADAASITEWLKEAPDETRGFITLDRYQYLVKVRVYLTLGNYGKALYLLKLLRDYAEWGNRTYIYIETGLLLSIALYRSRQSWKDLLCDSLDRASEFGFTRMISEEGAAILPLLKRLQSDYIRKTSGTRQWFETVLSETEQMASYYPGYMQTVPQKNDFSENSLKILRLQADGKNIREIAQLLGISERTVKYHAAENYRKLGARGKTDAVQKARNLNLL